MRLQTTATQVDFFPIGTGKRFVQRTTWHPGAESEMITYSTVVKSEMIYKVNNYLANGATVLDFNLEQIDATEYSPMLLTHPLIMKPEDKEFIDFLFDKLTKHVDTDMIDLQEDDTCCDHIQLELLTQHTIS